MRARFKRSWWLRLIKWNLDQNLKSSCKVLASLPAVTRPEATLPSRKTRPLPFCTVGAPTQLGSSDAPNSAGKQWGSLAPAGMAMQPVCLSLCPPHPRGTECAGCPDVYVIFSSFAMTRGWSGRDTVSNHRFEKIPKSLPFDAYVHFLGKHFFTTPRMTGLALDPWRQKELVIWLKLTPTDSHHKSWDGSEASV